MRAPDGYRGKLRGILSTVVAADQTLSSALSAIDGSSSANHAATRAASGAQATLLTARGALGALTAPTSDQTLGQQARRALDADVAYVTAVSDALSNPTTSRAAQLQTLASALRSALVALGPVAPGASNAVSGTGNLASWANSAAKAGQSSSSSESTGGSSTSTSGGSSSSGSSSASVSGGAVNGIAALPVQCGYGLAASAGITCRFANNAFYEYWNSSGDNPTQSESISVWSALGNTFYSLACSPGDGIVDCTGTNNSGTSLEVRFTQSDVAAYTTAQAAAYANSGKLGP